MSNIKKNQWAYLAGFLDGDGSIYVQAKPNNTYRFGYQISSTVAFYQSAKEERKIRQIQKFYNLGYIRKRKDGIIEWIIGREKEIQYFLKCVNSFLNLKQAQARLILEILKDKSKMQDRKDFISLMDKIEGFRYLNYSKKRKKRVY